MCVCVCVCMHVCVPILTFCACGEGEWGVGGGGEKSPLTSGVCQVQEWRSRTTNAVGKVELAVGPTALRFRV